MYFIGMEALNPADQEVLHYKPVKVWSKILLILTVIGD